MSRSTNPSRSQPPSVSKLKPDLEAMRKFKRILHGSAPAVFQTFSKQQQRSTADGKVMRMPWSQANAETLAKANSEGMHIAMTVNCLRGDRRRNEDVTRINAVFIDSDDGNISPSMLLKLQVPPHFIVKTSEKKLHAYWLLKNCTAAEFKALQKALAKKFGTDHDPFLEEKLHAELPGILNWALKGAMSYAKRGKLPECAVVSDMERRLRKEADPVLSWLVACTKKSASSKARSSIAYESYVRFMRREERKPLSTSQFRAKLENKGVEHVRARDANYFRGLRLIE